jgi:hypothetical protein
MRRHPEYLNKRKEKQSPAGGKPVGLALLVLLFACGCPNKKR